MLCAFAEQIQAAALAHHTRADGYPVLGVFTYIAVWFPACAGMTREVMAAVSFQVNRLFLREPRFLSERLKDSLVRNVP